MIQTIEIKTVEDADKLLLDQRYDTEINRLRSDYLYRGIPDNSYKLTTSLKRNCGDKQNILEPSILRYFSKYAIVDDPTFNSSVWKQMVVGQHYGLPTRLLDWSHSSLVAMHFATSEKNIADTDQRNGIIWRIDVREITKILPERYRKALQKEHTDFFSIDSLNAVVSTTADYDRDMGSNAMVIIEPPSVDQRIINQYSYFSIVPMGMDNIEKFLDENTQNTVKYVIDKNVRWDLRDLLDQLNMSERVFFPGLDGLSKWIARHYYVKNNGADTSSPM